jgi:hypothetical protein
MPNHIARGLPNDYREANDYSTKAAYRDGQRVVDQELTEAVIRMTFREMLATETLLNAKSRDAEMCIFNVQSGLPRADAHLYHGEYDHLL